MGVFCSLFSLWFVDLNATKNNREIMDLSFLQSAMFFVLDRLKKNGHKVPTLVIGKYEGR